jgi:RNA polymerase sigma-70 factor (ECF subfamily)
MPPSQLIAAAHAGDRDAIGTLLAATQPDIRRYARVTCRAGDVDDAVQDALWLIHRRIGTLRTLSAFSAWTFAVVKRECIRLARRAKGQAVPVETIEDNIGHASRPVAELRIDLAGAIQSLPAHYRETIVLRDIEELTIDEIAGRLGATRETVKARLHRARALVREYLDR